MEHRLGIEQLAPRARRVGLFVFDLSDNLTEFGFNDTFRNLVTVKTLDDLASFVVTTLLSEPTGRVGKVEHADEQHQGREVLQGEGDLPLGVRIDELTTIADPVGDKEAECDTLLGETGQEASSVRWTDLGLVQRYDHRKHTDSHAGDETTSDEHGSITSGGL